MYFFATLRMYANDYDEQKHDNVIEACSRRRRQKKSNMAQFKGDVSRYHSDPKLRIPFGNYWGKSRYFL